jgi:hypothetical protein
MRKVTLALTLMKGPEVAGWVTSMGNWLDGLVPANDDIPLVWDHFVTEFTLQYQDSQRQQRARAQLEACKMQFPHVDQYIAKFEDLARLARYTLGSEETNNLFIKGLSYNILDEVLRPPFATDYEDWKKKAIDTTKARQMVDAIRNRNPFQTSQFLGQRSQQIYRPPAQRVPPQTPRPPQGGWNSTNAPRSMNNVPVAMDLSRSRAPNNRRGRGRRTFNNFRPRQYASNFAQVGDHMDQMQADAAQVQDPTKRQKGPCFKCGRMGHLAAECYSRTQINYMDWEDDTQLSTPVLQPQNAIESLGAQINSLSKEDEEKLIGMLGAGTSKDFPQV